MISNVVRRLVFGFVLAFAMLLCGTARIHAQTATLSGTITDSSGAVIPDAQATVANSETGAQRVVTSDAQGRFTAPQLQPGRYQVTVSKEGFETLVSTGIALTVGQEAHLNLPLTVGSVTQQVTITAEAPLVDTSASAVTGIVNEERIQNLPLNGRDFSQLALIEPGVLPARKTDSTVQKGFGARISFAGSRPDQTGWLLDGTNIKSMSNFGTPGSASGLMLGVDAVREFQVLTSNYSAEYGGSTGGIVNMVTKSGTNQIHGTAYEYLRNDNMDARNFFDRVTRTNPKSKPEFKRNQFGASLGGPIRKDKFFVFGNYEALREREGLTNIQRVPDEDARRGILGPGTVAIAASVRPYLSLWPTPNGANLGGGAAELISVASDVTNQMYWMTRADYRINDNQSIFARFTLDQGEKTRPYPIPIVNADISTRTRYASVQYDRVWSSRWLSTNRIAFNRSNLASDVSLNIDYPTNLFVLNKRVPPQFSFVTGLDSFGPGDRDVFKNVQNLYEFHHNMVYSGGAHSVKFGFQYEKVGLNTDGGPRDNGNFQYNNLTAFLTDAVFSSTAAQVPGGQSQRSYTQHVYGLYLQDDWRVRQNLTLNLGLRYEPFTPPTEKWNRIAVVKDWVKATSFDTDVPFWNDPSKKNFSPRIGFAWDPKGDGKTAVRGGFGLFYVTLLGTYYRTPGVKNPPYSAFVESNVTNSNLASFEADVRRIAPTLLNARMTPDSFMEIFQWDLDPSYEIKFNFTVERELPGNMSVSLGYLGGRANHLWRSSDANASPSSFMPDGREFVAFQTVGANRVALTRVNNNTDVGTIRYTDAKSFYNGLLFGVKKRMSSGVTFQSSFTWSKTVDDATTGVANTDYNEGVAEYPYGPKNDRGLSGIHLGRNLTMNGTWDLPFPKDRGVMSYVLGGWQLSGIFSASDGTPFSVLNSGTILREHKRSGGVRPDYVDPNRSHESITQGVSVGCSGVAAGTPLGTPTLYFDPCAFDNTPAINFYGNSGRNILTGPGFANVDVNFKKNFPLGFREATSVEFSGGFFNLLNRPSFGIPPANRAAPFNAVTRARDPIAGQIITTSGESRQVQLGLKVIF
ncbi:MAG: TonB-dependent receptor [Acidobacteria bacterium]|nr:TonB-dependent receptor [Acidobacteriota bacterium]